MPPGRLTCMEYKYLSTGYTWFLTDEYFLSSYHLPRDSKPLPANVSTKVPCRPTPTRPARKYEYEYEYMLHVLALTRMTWYLLEPGASTSSTCAPVSVAALGSHESSRVSLRDGLAEASFQSIVAGIRRMSTRGTASAAACSQMPALAAGFRQATPARAKRRAPCAPCSAPAPLDPPREVPSYSATRIAPLAPLAPPAVQYTAPGTRCSGSLGLARHPPCWVPQRGAQPAKFVVGVGASTCMPPRYLLQRLRAMYFAVCTGSTACTYSAPCPSASNGQAARTRCLQGAATRSSYNSRPPATSLLAAGRSSTRPPCPPLEPPPALPPFPPPSSSPSSSSSAPCCSTSSVDETIGSRQHRAHLPSSPLRRPRPLLLRVFVSPIGIAPSQYRHLPTLQLAPSAEFALHRRKRILRPVALRVRAIPSHPIPCPPVRPQRSAPTSHPRAADGSISSESLPLPDARGRDACLRELLPSLLRLPPSAPSPPGTVLLFCLPRPPLLTASPLLQLRRRRLVHRPGHP
ncbi:hypothetical protein RJ55_04447 [Drechmeria coniospora]|nr:hypothetical protein RJ55_04447 [Drechmeria coniospora]